MRHIALRSMSVRHPTRTFTTPGLGDRIHQCICGWVCGPPVTLHLTADKWSGGQFRNKPESWAEIVALFPKRSLTLQVHPVSGLREPDWWAYLRKHGIEAEPFWYGDHPGQHEPPVALDIAPLLKRIPPLTAAPQRVALPARFFTVQWDSNDPKRSLTKEQRARVLDRYCEDGYEPVTVGGEAADPLRWSLKHIAFAMSRAAFHVGVDSAFMHLAQLFMPWERIHVYNQPGGFFSHHALRARDNGAPINLHL